MEIGAIVRVFAAVGVLVVLVSVDVSSPYAWGFGVVGAIGVLAPRG